jgi:hypothetical protein
VPISTASARPPPSEDLEVRASSAAIWMSGRPCSAQRSRISRSTSSSGA